MVQEMFGLFGWSSDLYMFRFFSHLSWRCRKPVYAMPMKPCYLFYSLYVLPMQALLQATLTAIEIFSRNSVLQRYSMLRV